MKIVFSRQQYINILAVVLMFICPSALPAQYVSPFKYENGKMRMKTGPEMTRDQLQSYFDTHPDRCADAGNNELGAESGRENKVLY